MKLRLAPAIAAAVTFLTLPAAAHAVGIEMGARLGANFANFRGDFADLVQTKGKLGLTGGPFVAFELVPHLALQAEALYSRKGARVASSVTDNNGNFLGSFDTFINVNYLEVPILVRGSVPLTPRLRATICAGPTLGFSLGGRVVTEVPGFADQKLTDLKSLDAGAAFGLGLSAGSGRRRFLVDVRYITGFGDIYDIKGNLESVNRVVSVMAGIGF
jgi:hypothetical protein